MKVGTKDTAGNEFFIEISIEDVIKSISNLKFFQKIKILFLRKTKEDKEDKEDNNFLSEIWAANKALNDANDRLESKISRIPFGIDASKIFNQTDDRLKFEKLFCNGGMNVSITDVTKLYNSITDDGKECLNSYLNN